MGLLTVVGTGIKSLAHMTTEAAAAIRHADKVLYGAGEPLTIDWIVRNAKSAECLDVLYEEGKDRMLTYNAMAEVILSYVRSGLKVCVSFEGHPGIFVDVAHRCIRTARTEGYQARMLPGVSAQDCLVADILIDPAEYGCQSFEATDFLLRGYKPDVTSMLVLWQVGCIGLSTFSRNRQPKKNVRILTEVLETSYGADHPVIAYQAALFSVSSPTIVETPLRRLPEYDLGLATLYVPPLREGLVNREYLARFGIA
ncbi:SAM-dependent methyltransferase [Bradyrhizobium elkanii]|uniref:SAM-dependent methyltransferase n=1 Tax=Bradyrhizobium elkanii TaxID=29448 RepID=UPI002711F117|nr:SAM-dependent methyltransferase [Bradyrhizobium elkanii]WLA39760.1 SAM-dependent methyltransferase [Bradyrhizobium elkanii]